MALSLSSCVNGEVDPVDNTPQEEIKALRFNIKVVNESNIETKVVKTGWQVGDKIFVFFNVTKQPSSMYSTGYLDAYRYVTLTYNGTDWDGAFSSSNTEDYKRLGTEGIMYAVYYPFGNVVYSSGSLVSTGHTNPVLNGDVYSYYLIDEAGSPYTMTLGDVATLSGTLHIALPEKFVYFYIDKQGDKFNESEKYRLSVEGVKPATVKSWSNGVFTTKELGAGKPMWGYKYGDGIAFAGMLDDSWTSPADHKFILFSDGDPALSKTMKNVTLPNRYSVKLANPLASTNGWGPAMEAPRRKIEMGAGGLKWGLYNLGAENIDEYGTAFRWGEIVPYSGTCDDRYATHSLTGNYAIYDVARAYLGSDWRMPTDAEVTAMKDGSTQTGPSSGTVTGGAFSVKGVKCESKTEPKNSIFFPTYDGSNGSLWTSTAANSKAAPRYFVYSSSLGRSSQSDISNASAVRPIYIGN